MSSKVGRVCKDGGCESSDSSEIQSQIEIGDNIPVVCPYETTQANWREDKKPTSRPSTLGQRQNKGTERCVACTSTQTASKRGGRTAVKTVNRDLKPDGKESTPSSRSSTQSGGSKTRKAPLRKAISFEKSLGNQPEKYSNFCRRWN
jgi:hypothetical protein